MLSNTGDARLDALDELSSAMAPIYDAKRNATATPRDDTRMKELHTQWMAIMWKLARGET
jgi:hypothetical protein